MYQTIHDDTIRLFMDTIDSENAYSNDFDDLIYSKTLTSTIFREYIRIFDKAHAYRIIECKYDENFLSDTSDLVDWKKGFARYSHKEFIRKSKK